MIKTRDKRGRQRVVITGIGAITPLGNVHQTYEAVIDGCSAIGLITRFDTTNVPVGIGGEINLPDTTAYFSRKDARRMPLVSQYAVIAAMDACADASMTPETIQTLGTRAATVIGTTMGPHLLAEEMTSAYRANGQQRPNPVEFANCLPNMPAHYVSRMLNTRGALHTPSAACATGTQALGVAADLIRYGSADLVVTGATEAIIQDYIYAGFSSMRALAEGYEHNPAAASRPFSADRSGFVLSEGSAVLILESLENAQERGAQVYGELLGHANTADAHHIAAIEPNARGMIDAMRGALEDADLPPDQIDYINAHGTGTEPNDRLETKAMKSVFGHHATTLNISSTKGALGHMMAATGAVEATLTLFAMRNQRIPPTLNLDKPAPECDLNYTPNKAMRPVEPLRYAMSNNYGLGGQNASVIFRQVNL